MVWKISRFMTSSSVWVRLGEGLGRLHPKTRLDTVATIMSDTRQQLSLTPYCRASLLSFGPHWAVLACILLLGCSEGKPAKDRFALSDVIPTGKTVVEILELRFSERVEELAKRWSSTVATNQDWWMDYVKKHADERPLPYHTNLGISESEYAEYLDGAKKTRHLRKVSDAYLVFKRKGDLLKIEIGDPTSPVEKWSLNVSNGELLTPTGNAGKPEWRMSADATLAIGAYAGYDWQWEKGDAAMSNVKVVSLSVYRLNPSGMIFWRLKDGEMQDNRSVRSLDLMFRYNPNQVKLGQK
jgi:hypothetical protein